jgi:RNA polymerase sigma factor (sigma-70 family)
VSPALVARLYAQSGAERWGVDEARFGVALQASVARGFDGSPADAAAVERYLSSLHLQDLALAIACESGHAIAWEHFIAEYRPVLLRAGSAIDRAGGADLADSLYADLYGLGTKSGERKSLFRYFHGRSRLATWLRAVMAQRHVDRLRVTKREDALDERDEPASPSGARQADPEHARFSEAAREALTAAIAGLQDRDRLRLAFYYARDMTLAAIGRLLGEHEATVSRHLSRTRRELRATAEDWLRTHHRMDAAAIAECFRSVSDDPGDLDLSRLLKIETGGKKPATERSRT